MGSLDLSFFSDQTSTFWPTTSSSTSPAPMSLVVSVRPTEIMMGGLGLTAGPVQHGRLPSGQSAHPECHPFFTMHGSGIDLVFPDLMHCKHLGTDQLLLGSILTWMTKHYMPGTIAENLELVWSFIKEQNDVSSVGTPKSHVHSAHRESGGLHSVCLKGVCLLFLNMSGSGSPV